MTVELDDCEINTKAMTREKYSKPALSTLSIFINPL